MKKLITLIAAGILAAFVVGCGNSDQGSTATAGSTGTPAATTGTDSGATAGAPAATTGAAPATTAGAAPSTGGKMGGDKMKPAGK